MQSGEITFANKPANDAPASDAGAVLVFDDCPLILFQWRRLLPERVVTIETSRECRDLFEEQPSLVESAAYAVIDYYFAKDMNGEQILAELQQAGFRGRAVFASDAPEGALPSSFERVPKGPAEASKVLFGIH